MGQRRVSGIRDLPLRLGLLIIGMSNVCHTSMTRLAVLGYLASWIVSTLDSKSSNEADSSQRCGGAASHREPPGRTASAMINVAAVVLCLKRAVSITYL